VVWAPDYADAQLVKDYLRIDDVTDDAFIAMWITAVSRNVDDHCGRQFGKVDDLEVRTYRTGRYDCRLGAYVVEIDDLFDTVGVEILGPAGAAVTDFDLWPDNAPQKGKPYTQLHLPGVSGRLTMEASWGWPDVPASIPTAMLIQAARLEARRDAAFGIAGSPESGTEMRLLAQLDPDFRTTLKPYVRKWWAR
jgi:hypothetical protein